MNSNLQPFLSFLIKSVYSVFLHGRTTCKIAILWTKPCRVETSLTKPLLLHIILWISLPYWLLECNEELCVGMGKALVMRWIRLQTEFNTNIVSSSLFGFYLGGKILNTCQTNKYKWPLMLKEIQVERQAGRIYQVSGDETTQSKDAFAL